MEQDEKTKEFIRKAKEIHGDAYDYSKVEYKKAIEKVIIICKTHGEFLQQPCNHLIGNGCRYCGLKKRQIKRLKFQEEYIKNCILTHHNDDGSPIYDYSKTEYTGCKNIVKIICKKHGEFQQLAGVHKKGHGCTKCAGRLVNDTKSFIEQAQLIHKDENNNPLYQYHMVDYKKSFEKVIIVCPIHGEFMQQPHNHLIGNGCTKCAGRLVNDTKSFIEQAQLIHKDENNNPLYHYQLVEYISTYDSVIIICPKHGEFIQKPTDHLRNSGCTKCAGRLVNDTKSFIEQSQLIHKDEDNNPLYEYHLVNYNKSNEHVIIICKKHGEFLQTPNSHLSAKYGCNDCAVEKNSFKQRITINDFIEKSIYIHGNKYDYSKSEYNGCDKKTIIICKKHGKFLQTPYYHSRGAGCPLCVNKTEAKLYEQLLPIYPTLIIQFKQDWCKRIKHLPYDFCIPEYNIIIELDGAQHFRQVANWSSPEEQQENDKFKETCANENGYSIIRLLQEDVFYDTYDWVKELCESIEEIKSNNEIINIYLHKNDEYDDRNI